VVSRGGTIDIYDGNSSSSGVGDSSEENRKKEKSTRGRGKAGKTDKWVPETKRLLWLECRESIPEKGPEKGPARGYKVFPIRENDLCRV